MRMDFMFRYLEDRSSQVMIFYSEIEDPKDSVARSSAIPWSTQFPQLSLLLGITGLAAQEVNVWEIVYSKQ